MSFAFIVMMMLLGSSVAFAFVLQPSREGPATSDTSVSHHGCRAESLESLRKGLLGALNRQAEPRLPAGAVDGVRAQWRSSFSTMTHDRAKATLAPVSPDDGNSTSLKCCSMASEISMRDLGWDNWVIYPASLTIIQCAACSPAGSAVQCPSALTSAQDADSQMPCCQPTSQEMVPIVYMDEHNIVVISSVQLSRTCGCRAADIQPPGEE